MGAPSAPVIVLPGAGGEIIDPAIFQKSKDGTHVETLAYPDWRQTALEGFSAHDMIAAIVTEIVRLVPSGPIRLVGVSIGGHFAYAAALALQDQGREVAGLCAIDSFMIRSAEPEAGWRSRNLVRALELLRKRRFGDLLRLIRALFWRALLRLAGDRLPSLCRWYPGLPWLCRLDPIIERELNVRLLIPLTAPWLTTLDHAPKALDVPAALLRTHATSADDAAWRRRCPAIEIVEIPGRHSSLLDQDMIVPLHAAFVAATGAWRL